MSRPTLYLSNWSSARTPGHHGPGRKLCAMAAPRRWEFGDGRVRMVAPDAHDLADLRAGLITVEDADCDCGYQAAADGVAEVCRAVLAGEDWR